MNLSTAQFTKRIKEASIRKILGLGKKQLSLNYFLEAFAFCLIALAIALGLTQLLLPGFNLITGRSLEFNLFSEPTLILVSVGLSLMMAAVSCSYPAFFLSGFNPVQGVKGKLKTGSNGKTLRNGLVVFQFCVSIVLIICTAIVYQQLNYMSSKDLGFNKENLLVIKDVQSVKNGENLLNASLNSKGVQAASWCTSLPPNVYGGDKFSAEGMNMETFPLNFTTADEYFIPTLDIKMKLGRNFSKDIPGDEERVILNEAAIHRIGWGVDESAIGKFIESPGGEVRFEVIGVVDDFNYWSLEGPIEPMAIFHIKTKNLYGVGENQFIALRIGAQSADAWEATINELSALWKTHAGDYPFQYEFVDQAFAETFKSQQQFGTVLTVMASLAILIASLGLLGMIVYALEQRTKEIGIRKVSGASVFDILKLISRGYTQLIIMAFVIAAPLAYWMMQQWLGDFSYKIEPSVWIFILTGLGTLLISILITSYHSVKAALTNPVDVLKDE